VRQLGEILTDENLAAIWKLHNKIRSIAVINSILSFNFRQYILINLQSLIRNYLPAELGV